MKKLSESLKAELTTSDLLQALVNNADPKEVLAKLLENPGILGDYVKKNREDVTKAINAYMEQNYQMKADKVIYQGDKIIVEAHTGAPIVATPTKAVRDRVTPEGHKKTNKGVFNNLREYLEDERKKKKKELKFDTVLKDMQFFFPKLTPRLLQIYLHDKRQLKGVDYSAKRGTVILK
jgi:hypothetical protein